MFCYCSPLFRSYSFLSAPHRALAHNLFCVPRLIRVCFSRCTDHFLFPLSFAFARSACLMCYCRSRLCYFIVCSERFSAERARVCVCRAHRHSLAQYAANATYRGFFPFFLVNVLTSKHLLYISSGELCACVLAVYVLDGCVSYSLTFFFAIREPEGKNPNIHKMSTLQDSFRFPLRPFGWFAPVGERASSLSHTHTDATVYTLCTPFALSIVHKKPEYRFLCVYTYINIFIARNRSP